LSVFSSTGKAFADASMSFVASKKWRIYIGAGVFVQLSSKKVIITVLLTLKTVFFHPKTVMAAEVAVSFYLACRFLAMGHSRRLDDAA